MLKAMVLFLLFVLFSSLPVYSQDVSQVNSQELTLLSSTIKDKLLSLRDDSNRLNLELETLSKSLENSQSEVAILSEELMKSSHSLTSINEELMNSYLSIELLQRKVKTRSLVVLILGIVFGVMIIAKIVGYVLYAKGVKVPRWLDILL